MKKTEILLSVVVLLGILMHSLEMPSANIVITTSFIMLSFFYTYLGVGLFNQIKLRGIFQSESYRKIDSRRIPFSIAIGISLGICFMGIVFKYLSFPGTSFFLGLGFLSVLILEIISIVKSRRESDIFYSRVIKRLTVSGIICLTLLFLPMKIWLDYRFPNNPEYVDAVMKFRADPENIELREKAQKEWDDMNRKK